MMIEVMIGLAIVAGAGAYVLTRKSGKLTKSPGSQRTAAVKNPLVQRIFDILTEDFDFPSKEMRKQMGEIYPDLAMAFRQSPQLGFTRYTQLHWKQNLSEDLLPWVINRVVVDYKGFRISKISSIPQQIEVLNKSLKRMGHPLVFAIQESEHGRNLVLNNKTETLFSTEEIPDAPDAFLALCLERLNEVLAPQQLRWTNMEDGTEHHAYALLSPATEERARSRHGSAYQAFIHPQSASGGSKIISTPTSVS